MNFTTKRLVESALLLALAVILEVLSQTLGLELPLGGTVTLASTFPVILISYKYGVKWGFLCAFAYALIQMALGADAVSRMFVPGDEQMILGHALCVCLLDYIVAYTVLGVGGFLRKKAKPAAALTCGVLTALILQYAVHILSGYIFYGAWAEYFFSQEWSNSIGDYFLQNYTGSALSLLYSVVYNGLFMIPEIVLTTAVALIAGNIPVIRKLIAPADKA